MTSETITSEAVRAALEAATPGPYYVKYGDVYAEGQEVPVAMCDDTEAPLIAMAPDLATAYLAQADELAEARAEIERLRKRVEAADRLANAVSYFDRAMDTPGAEVGSPRLQMCTVLAAYRATEGQT